MFSESLNNRRLHIGDHGAADRLRDRDNPYWNSAVTDGGII